MRRLTRMNLVVRTTFFTIDDEENKQILGYAETQVSEGQEGHPVDGDLAVFDGLDQCRFVEAFEEEEEVRTTEEG